MFNMIFVQDTDELLKFRRQWKEELELKQYHEQQGAGERVSGHASLTGTPDHTPQIQRRKDKEEEVNFTYLYKSGMKYFKITTFFFYHTHTLHWQATSLYWMGVAAEQSGDMHAGRSQVYMYMCKQLRQVYIRCLF